MNVIRGQSVVAASTPCDWRGFIKRCFTQKMNSVQKEKHLSQHSQECSPVLGTGRFIQRRVRAVQSLNHAVLYLRCMPVIPGGSQALLEPIYSWILTRAQPRCLRLGLLWLFSLPCREAGAASCAGAGAQ